MADSLGSLVVSLVAETAQFNDAMTKSAYQLNQTMGQMVSSVSGVTAAFSHLTTVVEAVVFSQVIRSTADFVGSMIEAQAHLQDLGVAVGVSAAQMSALVPAATLSGTSLDVVAQATARLERSISPLSATAKLGKEAMAALGFSAEDTARFLKDPSEGVLEIAQRLNTFADDGNKTAIVMALMGRGAAEAMPFLKQLGEQSSLTAITTNEQAAAAHDLVTQWNSLKLKGDELKNTLAADLVPAFADLLKAATASDGAFGSMAANMKTLAGDDSVAVWALKIAEAISVVVESLTVVVKTISAIGGSFRVVGDDMAATYESIAHVGSGPELAAAIAKRNADLADANKAWSDLWNANYTKLSDTIDQELAKVRSFNGQFAAAMAAQASLPQNADSTDRRLYGDAAQAPAAPGHLSTIASAAKAAKESVDELTRSFDTLMQSLSKTGATLDAQLASWATYGHALKETETASTEFELNNGKLGTLLAAQSLLFPQVAEAIRFEALTKAQDNDATHQAIASYEEYTAAHTKLVDQLNSTNTGLAKQVQALNDQAATLGMTKTQLEAYRIAQEDAKIALAEYMLEQAQAYSEDPAYIASLQQKVIELQNLRAAMLNLAGKEASVEATKAANEAARSWHDAARSISDDLITAFDDWVKGGKNLAQQLKDEVLRLFDSIVLKPLVLSVVTSILGGGSGAANAAGGVGGALSTGSSLLNLAGSAGGLFGAGGGLDTVESFLGLGSNAFSAGLANIGIAMSAGADAVGGFSAVLGAAIPVIAPILGIGALVASIFGNSGGGPKTSGFASSIPGWSANFPNETTQTSQMDKLLAGQQSTYAVTLAALGGTGTAQFGNWFDTDPKGTAPNRVAASATVDGKVVYNASDQNLGRDSATLQADIALQAQRAVLAALQASNLPKDIAHILDSVAPSTATADQITQVIELGTAYSDLGKLMAANPISDALDSFAKSSEGAFGSFSNATEAYQSLLSTYDGSTTATQALDKASQAYYQSLVALLAQIQQVKTSIDTMFGTTIRDMTIKSLDKQGQYDFYQSDAASVLAQIKKATDPTQISKLETRYNADINAAFGLLDPSQRTALLSKFIDAATAGQVAGDTRLTQLGANATTTFNDNIAAAQAAITKAANDMATAAGVISTAATTQSTAANTQLQAARTPLTVNVNLSGTANEVNSGG